METLEIINKLKTYANQTKQGDNPLKIFQENLSDFVAISVELSQYLEGIVGDRYYQVLAKLDPALIVPALAIFKARNEFLAVEDFEEEIEAEVIKLAEIIQDVLESEDPEINDEVDNEDEEESIIEEAFQNDEVIPAYSVTYVKPVAKDAEGNWIFETDEGLSYLEDHFFKI